MSDDDFDLVALRRRWAMIPEERRGVSLPSQTVDVEAHVGNADALAFLAPVERAIRARFPDQAREALMLLDRIKALLTVEAPSPASLDEVDQLLVVLEELLESALMFPSRR